MIFLAIINLIMLRSVTYIKENRFRLLAIGQSVDCETISRVISECDQELIDKVGGRVDIIVRSESKASDGVVVKVVRRRGKHFIYCFGKSTARSVASGLDSLRRYMYSA